MRVTSLTLLMLNHSGAMSNLAEKSFLTLRKVQARFSTNK